MGDLIGVGMSERRSLEEALTDLHAKYAKHPSVELARMIEQLRAEIAERKRPSLKRKIAETARSA